ncbi:GNAT family N-acetyltransferase [Geomicrobium sp. JCM 19037]|uniref:GNAT family N-acetyltransferase n=1 Tax=Geomicrobium sp. JCM 19037 TaxID=1460634 RepID=UPI0005A63CF5|nr:GNAT family protein [Geomicrobium sp. JCM 19037]
MLKSERVRLRKMTEGDAKQYHRWRNDLDVMKTTNPYLDVYTLEETEQFVKQVMLGSSHSKSYIIVDRVSNEAIGVTSLIGIDMKNRNAECIIDIGDKDYWGKGYGREAFGLLLAYSFLEMNLHRLHLQVFEFNTAALQLYEKLGFTREGIKREAVYRNGEYFDIVQMSLLKRDYSLDTTRI